MKFIILFLWFAASTSGCASYSEQMAQVQANFRSGQYKLALQKLEESELKEDSASRLLYHLEKGSILDRMGQSVQSRKQLSIADRIADDLYTTRLRKQALSLVTSDAYTDYAGEDYEKVAIHLIKALSFISDDKMKKALIEARRINTKLNAINTEYDEDRKNTYAEDAAARYLAGLIHLSQRNWDSAIIDFRKALAVYSGSYKKDFTTGPPDSLVLDLLLLYKRRNRSNDHKKLLEDYPELKTRHMNEWKSFADSTRVFIMHELGTIVRKRRSEHVFTWGKQVVRMSFPKIFLRPKSFSKTGASVSGKYVGAESIQNFDAIAAKTLDDRAARIFFKNAARIAAKGQINKEARKQFGPAGGLLVNIFNLATETADTRSWSSLPSRLKVTRLWLPVGKHDLKVYSDGKLTQLKTVDMKKNQTKIFRAFKP